MSSEQRGEIEGIPAMTVDAAIRCARGRVRNERLVEATHAAGARGLLSPDEEAELLADLASPGGTA